MLTETRNKHFSERLFYADNLPSGVGACHNGNIAAAYIANRDTACTFSYTYDAQNRLLSSVRLTENGTSNSELFTYDEVGNVLSLQRFSNNRKIDDLQYDYGNDGNQLLTVTDNGQDADDYSTIEYHNTETQADTTFRYDANGNLIYDLDRGISIIKYNILNLPDTIVFGNGCMIINLYDAAGRKYKSLSYTVPHTATSPQHEVTHLPYGIDTAWYCLKEYTGNIERIYTPLDTTTCIHNTTGYYTDSTYFHYIKDHLGNICAVVNSTRDSVIQSTLYYASGVPMSISSGREKQPYLYNGKEFVEAHGWNTYDYGFRGYYASIGRFTSIDPLAEQTPWQSPYSYAGNRFINAIDWLGLGEMTGFSSTYGWTAVNDHGIVVGVDMSSSDLGVYLVDGEWDGTYAGLDNYPLIGWQIPGIRYRKGGIYDFIFGGGGGIFSAEYKSAVPSWGYTYQFGFAKDNSNNALSVLSDLADFSALTIGLGSDLKCNSLWWIGKNGELYFDYQRHLPGGYARSYKIAEKAIRPLGDVARGLAKISIVLDIAEIAYSQEIKPSNIVNMGMAALTYSVYLSWVPIVYGVVDITLIVTTGKSVSDRIDDIGTIKF